MGKPSQAEVFSPPNPLDKAKNGDGPVKIDPNVLREAEQVVDDFQEQYPVWAKKDIDGLKAALTQALASPDSHSEAFAEIYSRALDLKGQGGGFGYDLVTAIGDLLTKFMEDRDAMSERDFAIVTAHVEALTAVFREDIKGDGGQVGIQIVDGLRQLVVEPD
jgi:hypothetical protein